MLAHTAMFVKADLYAEIGLYSKDFQITGITNGFVACSTRHIKCQHIAFPLVKMQTGGRSSADF